MVNVSGALRPLQGVFKVLVVMVALLGWPSSMWLFSRLRGIRMSSVRELLMIASLVSAAALSVAIPWMAMRSGVVALERMRR